MNTESKCYWFLSFLTIVLVASLLFTLITRGYNLENKRADYKHEIHRMMVEEGMNPAGHVLDDSP